MTTDARGRERRGVYMEPACWTWLEITADHDGSSVSDLLEGLVLLAMDRAESVSSASGDAGPTAGGAPPVKT